jgi:hypothetical protein
MTTTALKIRFPFPPQEQLAALKARVVRIGLNGTREGFKFAERMFRDYPELRGA